MTASKAAEAGYIKEFTVASNDNKGNISMVGGRKMKVKNSLKSLKNRHRANRVVRRKGRLYVINKVNKRFKARQG